jgi:hypothetical protein
VLAMTGSGWIAHSLVLRTAYFMKSLIEEQAFPIISFMLTGM